jgi:hypothetical protein
MSLLIISLLLGSFAILHGIGENFRADEGFGILISGLAIIGAVLLNGIPHLQNVLLCHFCEFHIFQWSSDNSFNAQSDCICLQMLGCVAVEPDIAVDGFGMLTSFLNTVDSCFLVACAQIVIGKLGSLFSVSLVISWFLLKTDMLRRQVLEPWFVHTCRLSAPLPQFPVWCSFSYFWGGCMVSLVLPNKIADS